MDRSYPSTRRALARARTNQRRGLGLATAIVGCALLYAALRPAAVPETGPMAPAAAVASPLARVALAGTQEAAKAVPRRVYPYSIVPGGVAGAVELARVMRVDKVVAAHYAEFEVDKAEEKTVTAPRAVHVSYRKGDKVYWTAKKVMLAEGEVLLSDGTHEMRKRCANRISDTPQLPVEANGPSEAELDSYTMADVSIGEDGVQLASLSADEAGEGAAGPGPGFAVSGGSGVPAAGTTGSTSADTGASATAAPFGASPGLSVPAWGGILGGLSSNSSTARTEAPEGATPENLSGGTVAGDSGSSASSGSSGPAPSGSDTGTPAAPGGGAASTDAPGSTGPTEPAGSTSPGTKPTTPTTPSVTDPVTSAPPPASTTPDQPSTGTPALPGSPAPQQPGGGSDPLPELPKPEPVFEPLFPAPVTPDAPQGGGEIPGVPRTELPTILPPLEQNLEPLLPPALDTRQEIPAEPTELPLPGSAWLFGAAAAAMALARRRRAR
jgi:hypothetical protein